jgi:Zn-dependent M28 family amino/carboxypeptidase
MALLLAVWFAVSGCSRPGDVRRTSPGVSPIATLTPTPGPLSFEAKQAYMRVLEQCGFGPRPTGSINNRLLGDYLVATLEGYGWLVEVQEFTHQDVPVRNVIARKGKGPVVILGAHYDTRPFADYDPLETQGQYILGANDGGSGVAVLLELARVLDMDQVPYEVRLAFFDAEDRGHLDGWPFSVGAQQYAAALDVTPEYVIVVDMVGDQNQVLYWEGQSDRELSAQIWTVAAELGYEQFFVPEVRWQIIDDHVPFVQRGWRAIDIIDFEYPYWHTTQDTADKVSAESLGRIGHVLEVFLESGASEDLP